MPSDITSENVIEAARELGQDEFTRGDLAEKLGVEKPEIRKGFKEARHAGLLEKTRDDDEGTGHFRLTQPSETSAA
jgi:Mn-dependent DtxR family transcriptional regulator